METTPIDLSKLSDVVKNEVVKKTEYNELVLKVNVIQTSDSNFLEKTDYDPKIGEIEKNILDHDYAKYITTQELNKLTTENFTARLKKANLATKADIDDFAEKTVKLTKSSEPDKQRYSGYCIGFDAHYQTVAGTKISLFLALIIVLLCMSIIKKKIFRSW